MKDNQRRTQKGGETGHSRTERNTTTIVKTMWYWYENKLISQWNGMENSKTDSQKYMQLILTLGTKTLQ